MSLFAIFLLCISLSADAFAASIAKGAARRPDLGGAIQAGLLFGGMAAIMPIIGWALGTTAMDIVSAIDHWIAFGLLGAVGGKMIIEGLMGNKDDTPIGTAGGFGAMLATAIGTSIDTAAVGLTLAFIHINIWLVALAIGITTGIMTVIGMLIGRHASHRLGPMATIGGGTVLVGIGTWILLDHLAV